MILSAFRALLFATLSSLVCAQMGFTNPDGSLNNFAQSFTMGSTVRVAWIAGWKGYGQDPGYADLFLTSFHSDAYSEVLIVNKSTAEGGVYNWRVNIAEDIVQSENSSFVFKWVRALDPPNYLAANPAAVLSPSRGFKVRLAVTSSSALPSSTALGPSSSNTAASASATTSTAPSPTQSNTAGTPSKSSTPVGAIVGGVVGGVVALAIIGYLLYRMRKMKQAHANAQQYSNVQYAPPVADHKQTYAHQMATPYTPQELPGYQLPAEADNYQIGGHPRQ